MIPRLLFSSIFLVTFFYFGFSQTQAEIESLLQPSSSQVVTKEKSSQKEKNVKPPKVEKEKDTSVRMKDEKASEPKQAVVKKSKEKPAKEKETNAIKESASDKVQEKVVKEPKVIEEKVIVTKEKTVKEKTNETAQLEKTNTLLSITKFKVLKKQGDALFLGNAFEKSANIYKSALANSKKSKQKIYLLSRITQCYMALRDYPQAQKYAEELIAVDKKSSQVLSNYWLANAQVYQADYQNAKENFRIFNEKNEKSKLLDYEKSKARLGIKSCDYALELVSSKPQYTIENLSDNVNGPYADFGPDIRGNELVFSKIKTDDFDENEVDNLAKMYSSTLYKGDYEFAQEFSDVINEGDAYVCNPSFSADGKTLFFSKCSMQNHVSICNIYASMLENGVWTQPQILGENINQIGSSTSHPQIVLDESGQELLFFQSDRISGRGGKDIYFAQKLEGIEFSKAKNIGAPINTRFDEISPFYHAPTQTLYYSTNGELSLGGFDIYASIKDGDEWSTPRNLEYPFNSSLDDYDLVFNKNGKLGYLVSNREGTHSLKSATCCDDIFELRSLQFDVFIKVLVYEEMENSRQILDSATLILNPLANPKPSKNLLVDGSFFTQLAKESDYELLVQHPKYESVGINVSTKGIQKDDTLNFDIFLKNEKVYDNEVIASLYYEYNQAKLTNEAPKTLEFVLNYLLQNKSAIIEIHAHTDDKGTEDYNMNLSKGRAEAAAKYLEFYGVESNRITKKWFGESKPIAPNVNIDGSDNPEGRAKNRRTDFLVFQKK